MYVQMGKKITEKQVIKYIKSKDYMMKDIKKHSKDIGDSEENTLKYAAKELVKLNNAILKGYEVYVETEKEPRNLDSGKHWFQVYYLTIENKKPVRKHFWIPFLMDTNKDRSCYHYGFSSSAIGMSRKLNATDNIFVLLKNIGGCYVQL